MKSRHVDGGRISILLPDLRGGGAERVSIDLARAFAALGWEVEFVLMNGTGELLSECEREFAVVDLAVARFRSGVGRLRQYLRRRRPAAIIAMMWPLTAIAPVAARLSGSGSRVAVCEHGMLSLQYSRWGLAHWILLRTSTAVGYRLAHVRIGVSVGVALDMAMLASLHSSQLVPVNNSVRSLSAPSLEQIEAVNLLWKSAGPRILAVGTLKPVKNYHLLLKAFSHLSLVGARLMFVGCGEQESELRELTRQLGLADRVIFAGFHSNPAAFYATADLFVLSSNSEGLPTVLIEALSFGLPVVATDCPSGPAEILENGQWGRLVPVGDAGAFTRAMEESLAAPRNREGLKRRAADFAPEIAAHKYLNLLGLP